MTRKDFLKSAVFSAVGGWLLFKQTACKSSPTTPTNPGTSKDFTSTTDQSHSHTVTVQRSEIDSPPAAGLTRTASSSGGHTHTFIMTQTQLLSVQGGTSVIVTTSTDSGHSHDFTIGKWY